MVPPLADQLTVEPVCTVALHCDVPFGSMDAGLQVTAILAAAAAIGALLPPPHPVHNREMLYSRVTKRNKYLDNSLFIPHRRRPWGERAHYCYRKFQVFATCGVVRRTKDHKHKRGGTSRSKPPKPSK
jgi:hypothetical protein